MRADKAAVVFARVPKEIHRLVKAEAAERGLTIEELIKVALAPLLAKRARRFERAR